MDPEKVYRAAWESIQRGADPTAILNHIAVNFDAATVEGAEEYFRLMRTSARGAREARPARAPGELHETPRPRKPNFPGAAGDALMSTIPGLASWADELLGPEAGQRMQDMRELNPGTTTALGIAGGMALPGVRAASAGGLLRGMAQGGAYGAVEGGIMGMGEAEGNLVERVQAPETQMGAGAGFLTAGALGLPAALLGRTVRKGVQGGPGLRTAVSVGREGGETTPTGPLRAFSGGRYGDIPRPDDRIKALEARQVEVGQEVYSPFQGAPTPPGLQLIAEDLRVDPRFGAEIREAMGDLEVDSFDGLQRAYSSIKQIADSPITPNTSVADRTTLAQARALAKDFGTDIEAAFPGFLDANMAYRKAGQVSEAYRLGYLGSRSSGRTTLDETASIANLLTPARLRMAIGDFDGNPEAQSALKEGLRARMTDDFLSQAVGLSPTADKLVRMEPERAREVVLTIFDTPESAAAFKATLERAARDADGTLGQLISGLARSVFIQRSRPRGG